MKYLDVSHAAKILSLPLPENSKIQASKNRIDGQ